MKNLLLKSLAILLLSISLMSCEDNTPSPASNMNPFLATFYKDGYKGYKVQFANNVPLVWNSNGLTFNYDTIVNDSAVNFYMKLGSSFTIGTNFIVSYNHIYLTIGKNKTVYELNKGTYIIDNTERKDSILRFFFKCYAPVGKDTMRFEGFLRARLNDKNRR